MQHKITDASTRDVRAALEELQDYILAQNGKWNLEIKLKKVK